MKTIKNKLKQHKSKFSVDLFINEKGAIDLASIMVGVIVIGLIGGVIAATVFTVIPWSQDNAAKQQLDSIASAESAYMGLSSANSSPLPAGYVANSFGNSSQLAAGNLLQTGDSYCAVTPADGKSYTGYSKSASGKVWFMTDKNTKPAILTDPVPAECGFTAGVTPAAPAPYVDPNPTLTSLTYQCDTTTTGLLPWQNNLTGKETWDDGTAVKTYSNVYRNDPKTLLAGKIYKVTFDGTYTTFNSSNNTDNLAACLISMDHWGSKSGVVNAMNAFYKAPKFVAVPDRLPSTVNNINGMFWRNTLFNDPNVTKWDVSNVTDMTQMFAVNVNFNQDISGWDVSKVTGMRSMFYGASKFNKNLGGWDTSSATDMSYMFYDTTNFNQNIKGWNVAKVKDTTSFRVGSALTAANSPF